MIVLALKPLRNHIFLINVLFLLLGAVRLIFAPMEVCAQHGPPAKVKVQVYKVERGDLSVPKEYLGTVEAIYQVDVRTKIKGYIERVAFKEGQFVKEGDLLYVLEQAPYKAAVKAAEARVEQAKAELFRASRYLDRLKEVKTGAISQSDLDNATATELKAKADLKLYEAQLEAAKLELSYTQIRAPISGKVGKSLFKEGDLVSTESGTLTRIVDLENLRVVFSVPQKELPLISHRSSPEDPHPTTISFRVLFDHGEGNNENLIASLDFINNEVDPKTGTIAIWLRLKNQKQALLPGQYVKVQILRQVGIKLPLVPQRAVMQDQKGKYVLLVNNNKVTERRITASKGVGQMLAVEEGLSEGELVVVEGVQKVRPGQEVEIELTSPSGEKR